MHTCPSNEFLKSIDLKQKGVLLLGNNKPCNVQGLFDEDIQ